MLYRENKYIETELSAKLALPNAHIFIKKDLTSELNYSIVLSSSQQLRLGLTEVGSNAF